MMTAEGAENGLEFTIVRPFNWIGPRMDFIPGVDGPSEGVPRVLACFSNVSLIFSAWVLSSFVFFGFFDCDVSIFHCPRLFFAGSRSSLWMVVNPREHLFILRMPSRLFSWWLYVLSYILFLSFFYLYFNAKGVSDSVIFHIGKSFQGQWSYF